jgi:hypothetical protein
MEREEEARPIPGDAVGRPRPAVRDRSEACECTVEELARSASARVRDQPDATRIALSGRVVERGGHEVEPPFASVGRDVGGASRLVWCALAGGGGEEVAG